MGLDYSTVQASDLEMVREPRKSTFTVIHKPTNTVGTTPVVPGTLSEARFRRVGSKLPKENRVAGMEGYIEGVDEADTGIFAIVTAAEGREAKNEYLEALVANPAALKATFEGKPKGSAAPAEGQTAEQAAVAPSAPSETPQAPVETPQPAAAVPEAAPAEEAVSPSGNEELDDLLATLE
jgi:hypothetical protein